MREGREGEEKRVKRGWEGKRERKDVRPCLEKTKHEPTHRPRREGTDGGREEGRKEGREAVKVKGKVENVESGKRNAADQTTINQFVQLYRFILDQVQAVLKVSRKGQSSATTGSGVVKTLWRGTAVEPKSPSPLASNSNTCRCRVD